MLARLNTAHKAPNVGLAIEGHVHPLGLGQTTDTRRGGWTSPSCCGKIIDMLF